MSTALLMAFVAGGGPGIGRGDEQMSTALLMAFVAGGATGAALGRWWAEIRRAQHDMRRTWRTRKTYRGRRR